MSFPLRPLAVVFLFLLVPIALTAQSQGTITQGSNLRADPSTHQPPIQTLAKGTHVTVLNPKPMNGFYQVRTPEKKEGWVWGKNLTMATQASQIPRKLVRRPAVVEEAREALGAAAACASDLNSCPVSGCAAPDAPHGLANELKRRVPTSSTVVPLTFDDFQTLQQQADNLVGENKELKAEDRAKLASLAVGNGLVSEGDVVSIVGYLVGVPHPNTGESVNCNLKGAQNNDFHIPISNDPDNTDFQAIVVEMIPQDRPDTWTLANLTQVANNRQLVMVTGALFYDNFHLVNGDPSSPKRGQPHRFSLWEAHPLTQFVVCTKPDNTCDPTQAADWTPLGINP
jgi:uncharacterized protein YgiM (DUF1202 family)